MLAELHRDPRKRARVFEMADFHPHYMHLRQPAGMRLTRDNLHDLKPLFSGGAWRGSR